MEGSEFPGMFLSASSDAVMLAWIETTYEIYETRRRSHHEAHENEVNPKVSAIIINVGEMQALLDQFKDREIPDMLCPLLSELRETLSNHVTIMPMGEKQDPRLN
jgi:hypothetical protein